MYTSAVLCLVLYALQMNTAIYLAPEADISSVFAL